MHRRWNSIVFLPLLLCSHTFHCVAQNDTRTCYDASNKVTDHRACISSKVQSVSHCCSLADTCIGNTLCLSQWGTLYVGSCTVDNWITGKVDGSVNGKGACPQYCGTIGGDIGLCNTDPVTGAWNFCCGALDGHEKCCAGTTFKLSGNATNEYMDQRPWEKAAQTVASAPTVSSTSTPGAAASDTANNNTRNGKAQQIGLSVGLGIPLLIAMGLLFWENRRRRHAEAQLAQRSALPVGYVQQPAQTYGDAPVLRAFEAPGAKYDGAELPAPAQVHEIGHVHDGGRTASK